jgi:hypothetical protein
MKALDAINRALQNLLVKKGRFESRLQQSKKSSPSTSNTATKEENLLAFRTIITMLSYIGSIDNRSDTEDILDTTKELRLLDAMSAVLIRELEVTAVVAHPFNGYDLQVFCSVAHSNKTKISFQPTSDRPNAQGSLQPSDEPDEGLWKRLRNYTASVNPRNSAVNGNNDCLMNSTSLREKSRGRSRSNASIKPIIRS